jgi:hypothetical protein
MTSESGEEALPNGSRLSWGRRVRGRKAVEPQRKRLAGEATSNYPVFKGPATL